MGGELTPHVHAHVHKHTPSNNSQVIAFLSYYYEPTYLQTYSSNVAIPTTHGLKHSFIQSQFKASFIKHFSLIGITSDESVHLHSFALSNSMTTCLGLIKKRTKRYIILSLLHTQNQVNLKKKFLPHLVEWESAN